MKRRNADCSKLRRPPKRTKITDGIYGSAFVYLKLFMIWALVLMADFIVDFRFEYLWPLWLLTQSLYDSFKYQGLAFSIFFVCVTVTSDVACYLFIPVQWLFLTASTYVWVQYVWQTERGVSLPTILLWTVFLYVEVMVRLKEFKNFPFHLDLCRPFAAHCVGYPVITMGFSFKSCISYRFRLIKQKDVQKENQFYMDLLQQALPSTEAIQQSTDKLQALPSRSSDGSTGSEVMMTSNGSTSAHITSSQSNVSSTPQTTVASPSSRASFCTSFFRMLVALFHSDGSGASTVGRSHHPRGSADDDNEYLEQYDDDDNRDEDDDDDYGGSESSWTASNSNGVVKNNVKVNNHSKDSGVIITSTTVSTIGMTTVVTATSKKAKSTNVTSLTNSVPLAQAAVIKDNLIPRLEADIKRLKADLQCSRNTEQELKTQICSLTSTDRATKNELYQLRQDNENLQGKLHKLVTGKQQDKQNLAQLERRLQEEKKQRTAVELQVAAEKRRKSEESASRAAASAAVVSTTSRSECTLDSCKTRRWELENELKQARRELKLRDDQIRQLERETQSLQQYRESQTEAEVLMSALGAMQDKNTHLENSLSAETRLKLDLFSALGDAKRQIEIQQALLIQKEVELADLKSKVAEVMAFMPSPPVSSYATGSSHVIRYSPSFVISGQSGAQYVPGISSNHVGGDASAVGSMDGEVLVKSSLNPSASDYTPKVSQ